MAKVEHPIWFGLEADQPATVEQIAAAELELGVTLPPEYVKVVTHLGGGFVGGFITVYSLDPASSMNLVARNRASGVADLEVVVFSDSGCGDFYAFPIVARRCKPGVVFVDHQTRSIHDTEYATLLDFLVNVGLHA